METVSASSAITSWFRERLELGRVLGASTLLPMEGLRGVAVLLVFLVHYASLVQPFLAAGAAKWLVALHAMGNTGVDLFFVLSGFLIYGSVVGPQRSFLQYLKRRVQRIYPAFLAVFALYLVLALWRGDVARMPPELGAALVYVLQNLLLLPGLFPIEPLITVAWSLSYEFFFYLALPLVAVVAGVRQRDADWRLRFILLVTACSLSGFALWGGPVRLVMFLAGMLLFELHQRGWRLASSWGLLGAVLALAVTLLPMPGPALQALRVGVVYVGFLLLCMAALCPASPGLARSLCWTPLRWLGNFSYSYYLLHGLSLQVFFLLLGRVLPPVDGGSAVALALLLPAFAATLPASLLLFLTVERPFSLAPKRDTRPVRLVPETTV